LKGILPPSKGSSSGPTSWTFCEFRLRIARSSHHLAAKAVIGGNLSYLKMVALDRPE
jgi:hypothetical protein